MWPFRKTTEKEKMLCIKDLKIGGMKFKIKKINPFLDFPAGEIPQIFSDFMFKKNIGLEYKPTEIEVRQIHKNIIPILEAGIYRPILTPIGVGENRGKEKGLTVNDLFIDREIAFNLFHEIINHSLNKFKGLVGLFFSAKIKLWLSTHWQINMANVQLT